MYVTVRNFDNKEYIYMYVYVTFSAARYKPVRYKLCSRPGGRIGRAWRGSDGRHSSHIMISCIIHTVHTYTNMILLLTHTRLHT